MTTVEEFHLARVLEECLETMERGETDLDRLAGLYPDDGIWTKYFRKVACGHQGR